MAGELTLKKEERIYKKNELKLLVDKGEHFTLFPFKVIHLSQSSSDDVHLKIALSVPKRRFKKAVDRNLLKRRMREAYRKNRSELKAQISRSDRTVLLLFIYIGDQALEYQKIEQKIILILQRLQGLYAKDR